MGLIGRYFMKEMAIGKEISHPMLSPTPPTRLKKGEIISAEESIRAIRDGDTIATRGFAGTGFSEVTRYTTSTSLRMKLGDALQSRGVKPHIYESSKEAHEALKKG
jgi:hypothetical protein